MKNRIDTTLTALLICSSIHCFSQDFRSPTPWYFQVKKQVELSLRGKDRMTILVDSLNATIEKYGQLVDQKDRIITSQDSIIAEKSKQEVFYQDIILSKNSEIKITTKALKRNAFWNKFFKVTTVLGIGTTAALLITR